MYMEIQRTQNSKNNFEKEQNWNSYFPISKQYKAAVTKTVWHWLKDRTMFQWKRTENPDIDP